MWWAVFKIGSLEAVAALWFKDPAQRSFGANTSYHLVYWNSIGAVNHKKCSLFLADGITRNIISTFRSKLSYDFFFRLGRLCKFWNRKNMRKRTTKIRKYPQLWILSMFWNIFHKIVNFFSRYISWYKPLQVFFIFCIFMNYCRKKVSETPRSH